MKIIQRIATLLVAILLAGGLLVAPAQADEPKEPVPTDCTVYTGPLAERAATMVTELRAAYSERDQYRVERDEARTLIVEQRDRAEAFKAQVARKNDKIAELRALLRDARK